MKTNKNKEVVRLISHRQQLPLEALDGSIIISHSTETFRAFIDPDFKNLRLNQRGSPTPETVTSVYLLVKGGYCDRIFSTINPDLDKIVMSQHQIVRFCQKYPQWLSQGGYLTFFLIKKKTNFFVVHVITRFSGLCIGMFDLQENYIWSTERRHRLVTLKF